MTAAAVTSREYVYEIRAEDIDRNIAFAEVVPSRDFDRLRSWFSHDHVKPYWQLDLPESEFRAELDTKLAAEHLTPYVGLLNHVPMSYWETYRAAEAPIGGCYDADPEDRGIHLLFGPPEYLGHGYAAPLLRALTTFQFRESNAERVISEPDVRNERAIHVFKQCGYEPQGTVNVPEKEAMLLHCERDQFFAEVAR